MSERTPDSFWHRLLRKIDDAANDEEREVDQSIISFHLLFIVPLFLVLIMLMRR